VVNEVEADHAAGLGSPTPPPQVAGFALRLAKAEGSRP
jgi:hypothetical protein